MRSTFSSLLFLLLSLTVGGGAVAHEKEPSPDTIIKTMTERYAAASTYQDVGVVEITTGASLPTRSTDVAFKLHFSRPRKLRFEWADLGALAFFGKTVVWSDGERTFSHYRTEPGKVEQKEDLGMGIAGATGVSLGSAATVPSLLLKNIAGFSPADLERISLKGQERFEDEDCFVLEGFHPTSEPWRLWVGKRDFLLRKIRTGLPGGESQEEIHRDIRINEPIPEETFRVKIKKSF
jgi:outer membrane lipoprotein-sorting protein